LGRYKTAAGELMLEVRGGYTEQEAFRALLLLLAVTPAVSGGSVSVMLVRPDEDWQSQSFVWDVNRRRLERFSGDGDESLFRTYPPGTGVGLALTRWSTGVLEDVDPTTLETYAEGSESPRWLPPEE